MVQTKRKTPLVTEVLELYTQTPEGLPLWKTKGVELNCENLLENVFVLSSDLAVYFNVKHNDLSGKNLIKLQKEGYLSEQLRNFSQLFIVGQSAKRERTVYALTRHETERLIMDFSGPKARQKKYAILLRLQAIEADVLRGAYAEAREKAQTWEGVRLLKELGTFLRILWLSNILKIKELRYGHIHSRSPSRDRLSLTPMTATATVTVTIITLYQSIGCRTTKCE